MTLIYKKKQDSLIVYLEGSLNFVTSGEIEKEIFDLLLNNKFNNLIISLEKVDYLSSPGLRIFISILRIITENNKILVLYGLTDFSIKLFNLLGITNMFNIFLTEEEAFDFIDRGQKEK